MALGDHIYVKGFPHDHHGIDCGDGTVIHYEGKFGRGEISRVSKGKFSNGNKISIKNYDKKFSPSEIIKRAERRLGEKEYNLVFNNCEHFVRGCTTGEADSYQLNNVGVGVGVGALGAAGVSVAGAAGLAGVTVPASGLMGLIGSTIIVAPPVGVIFGGAALLAGAVYGALKTIDNWDD